MFSEKDGGSEPDSWVDVAPSERSYVTANSAGVPWPGTGDGWKVPASQKGKGGKGKASKGSQAGKATGHAKQGSAPCATGSNPALSATGSAKQSSAVGAKRRAKPGSALGATGSADEDLDLGSQDGTASQGSALSATGSGKQQSAQRGKGLAQDGTANQSSALGATGSANEDFVLGGKGGGVEPGSKKLRGNAYECAECRASSPHTDMIKSMRQRHTRTSKPEAASGDAVQDALGQKRFKDLSLEQVAKVYLKLSVNSWRPF